MIIPDGHRATRQVRIPQALIKGLFLASFLALGSSGLVLLDYLQLRSFRRHYQVISAENEGLKGEARVLMQNLEEVKVALRRVQDYTSKLWSCSTCCRPSANKKISCLRSRR